MIIGITGNGKKNKNVISKYLDEKYSFKYFDVDTCLERILKEKYFFNDFSGKNWKENESLLIEIKNVVDFEIAKYLETISDTDIVVLDYSILEDSIMFDRCDLVIKSQEIISRLDDELSVLKAHRINSIASDYNSSKYHLELDMDADWQSQLSNFIDYNIYSFKKVTVVVPIHNTANYLSRSINSITNQSYRNLEIILIDDGSTDESLKICQLLAQTDSRIRVIHQDNVGLAETRNRGMELATGEYICFFDSDDYIENSMVSTLLKTAEQTKADVCESSFYIHMKEGFVKDVSCEQKGVRFVEGQTDLINAYSDATILIPAWDKIYKLSSIRDIKFDKSCFKEDADYIYKLCMAGKTFALVNIPFYHYVKRKSTSLTGSKISPRLFTLSDWGKEKYKEVLAQGEEYTDAAEKILYNSLVHIVRNYMRDHKNGVLNNNEYQDEIQTVVNDTISLLLNAKNVKKFRKLDEVLEIINQLISDRVIVKEKMPSLDLPCVGILWNSLNEEFMSEAIEFIQKRATINECVSIDLKDEYRNFINEIYRYNKEFEGIPFIKSSTLIDKFDSNTIVILNLIVKVTNYIYYNSLKGYMFEEIAELKSFIRKYFKPKIREYAYDNIFHLTVDPEEYEYTDGVCKRLIKDYKGSIQNGGK